MNIKLPVDVLIRAQASSHYTLEDIDRRLAQLTPSDVAERRFLLDRRNELQQQSSAASASSL